MKKTKESPFTCVMDAIAPEERAPHLANAKQLFNQIEEIRELDNGYSFCFPTEANVLSALAEFIALERLCCPFFSFTLEIEPYGGSTWLALTGRAGVKPFIQLEIGEIIGRPISVTRSV